MVWINSFVDEVGSLEVRQNFARVGVRRLAKVRRDSCSGVRDKGHCLAFRRYQGLTVTLGADVSCLTRLASRGGPCPGGWAAGTVGLTFIIFGCTLHVARCFTLLSRWARQWVHFSLSIDLGVYLDSYSIIMVRLKFLRFVAFSDFSKESVYFFSTVAPSLVAFAMASKSAWPGVSIRDSVSTSVLVVSFLPVFLLKTFLVGTARRLDSSDFGERWVFVPDPTIV